MAFHPAVLAAVLLLALPAALPQSARTQGTDAQRDACTPDALRLCQGTIPNVARTTACLVAHRPQLSATCRNVFAFAEPVADMAPPARADRAPLERPRAVRLRPGPPHMIGPRLIGPRLATRAHPRYRVRLVRRGAYHIPRFNQAQAEAEVHQQYSYRTPYLPYWVFP